MLFLTFFNSYNVSSQSTLIHFWYFDESIPNNTPLEELDAFYSVTEESSRIEYHSALAGYPFDSDHPNWRKASMERRNAPTEINYRPIANNGLPYNTEMMRGIQVRQPFTGDGGENTVIFHLPTSGYEEILFSFAAVDEGAAESLIIDYSLQEEPVWITDGMQQSVFPLVENYLLFTVDFSPEGNNISAADDNPYFKIRIRFDGDFMDADDGNRVTFNNISLDGQPLPGTNNPPVVSNSILFQKLIENGNTAQFDLNDVYTDPEDDNLTFDAESTRPDFVQVNVSGSNLTISPVRRGDAVVTISADDGFNPAVTQTFRVLVYPRAFDMQTGSFIFEEWNNNQPELTYPENMIFLQSDISDPEINYDLIYPYFIPDDDYHSDDEATIGFPYNNTRRTRINGLGAGGVSFINTGRDRDLGGALVALNTQGKDNLNLSFLAGTMLRNERLYAIRLQYRTGTEGSFQNLLNDGQIVEYLASADGHMQTFEYIELPQELINQEYIQLLWRYYFIDGDSGPRPQLRLDDIVIGESLSNENIIDNKIDVWTADKTIFIKNLVGEDLHVRIYNLMGQLISVKSIRGEGIHSVDGNFSSGMYLITIQSGNIKESQKVIIR
ncbi:MAG: T9SS type A sorting domain-containing protein [Bacteroidales bacterium]